MSTLKPLTTDTSSRDRRIAHVLTLALCGWGAALAAPVVAQVAPAASDVTRLPAVMITAQKEAQALQAAALSVTPTTRSTLEDSGARLVNDVALFAPNTFITEFSARKLSNARFRGLGSSPNNPAVTTFIDGVPQLNANTSSLDLLDVDQVEFVRGPQGALFGRNTVGGLINITSTRPSFERVSGGVNATFGDYDLREYRANVSGPLDQNEFAFALAGGYSERKGFAKNTLTGHDIDHREASFGKGQLVWRPMKEWEARLIVTAEKARDGDYRLHDLAAVRLNPRSVTRDYEGFTHRSVVAPTLIVSRTGGAFDLTLTTGGIWWDTLDATDLDYSAAPLIQRENTEKGTQFTQEVRISSPRALKAPVRWQAGAFFFSQGYKQDAFNFFPNPVFLRYPVGTPAFRSYTTADLDDVGYGLFGQLTFKARDNLDLSVGLRADREDKDAVLRTFTSPAGLGAVTNQNLSDDFSEVSPHATALLRLTPEQSVYASIARGYKAGGFNAASPAGTERFGQEYSWNYEAGFKATWLDNRVRTNLAAFYTRWNDLQLNVPNPTVPGQFFVANVGEVASKGVEMEINARPAAGWDVFAGAGWVAAKFRSGSRSGGVAVDGRRLPFTPDYTFNAGTQVSIPLAKQLNGFVRGEVVAYGRFFYDDQNGASQSAYSLTNFRAGLRARNWTVEAWLRNAFDKDYVPLAIPYAGLAPSGFLGESGAPMTMGLSVGLRF